MARKKTVVENLIPTGLQMGDLVKCPDGKQGRVLQIFNEDRIKVRLLDNSSVYYKRDELVFIK